MKTLAVGQALKRCFKAVYKGDLFMCSVGFEPSISDFSPALWRVPLSRINPHCLSYWHTDTLLGAGDLRNKKRHTHAKNEYDAPLA